MKITVLVPVGPSQANKRWLGECLASVAAQTRTADEVLLIDDMAGLAPADLAPLVGKRGVVVDEDATLGHSPASMPWSHGAGCAFHVDQPSEKQGGAWHTIARVWRSPWRLGVAHAFNFGVALAQGDGVFMLGSDDVMRPDCLAQCEAAWTRESTEGRDPRECYFWVGVHYLDDRQDPDQFLPCGTAMVSRALWDRCGGFPTETAVGAPDAALISIMMVHEAAGRIVPVNTGRVLCDYRPHAETDTAGRGPWQGAILAARDILTRTWEPPNWSR